MSPSLLIAVFIWIVVSTFIILVNKVIMVDIEFPHPVTVTLTGTIFSCIATYALKATDLLILSSEVDKNLMYRTFLPVGFSQALTMFSGNLAYLYLSVSFIQMTKALTPVFTMVALLLTGLERPSFKIVVCVLVIAIGTCVASYGEVHLTFAGFACVIISEIAEAARLVLTQYLLVGRQYEPLEGLFYLSQASALWLSVLCIAIEVPAMLHTHTYTKIISHMYLFIASGTSGFLVSLLGFHIIKSSSALTLKVLVAFRSVVLVGIGVYILGEVITALEAVGYGISLCGFLWYNIEKHSPSNPDAPKL